MIQGKPLFFIHSISRLYNDDGNAENLYQLNLYKVLDNDSEDERVSLIEVPPVQYNIVSDFSEGQFVYFENDGAEISLNNANGDPRARRYTLINNRMRALLTSQSEEPEEGDLSVEPDTKIYSYHVNVGHGNCSFIVIKNVDQAELWCVDCSNWDFKQRHYYGDNIERCLAHISAHHHVNTISKFFITHPHYDHISGIKTLITNNGLPNAEIWLNTFYSFSSKTYDRLLEFLENSQLHIIQPFPWNNTPNITSVA